jgi:hypothetical protein
MAAMLLLALLSTPAAAQKDAAASPKYDFATEAHFKGTIEEVKEIPTKTGPAIHLMFKTGGEVMEVYLCPHAFLQEMEMGFAKGDQIEVTGSKVKVDDADVILAKEVVKGNDTLILRDKKGAPVWLPAKHG